MATPIWDKADAQDVSMYDDTPFKEPLAAFAKLMLEDGRSGHSSDHIARCIPKPTPDVQLLLCAKLHASFMLTCKGVYQSLPFAGAPIAN